MRATDVTVPALARLDLGQADTDPTIAGRIDALVRRGAVRPGIREAARAILTDVRTGGAAAVRANRRYGRPRRRRPRGVGSRLTDARDASPAIRAGIETMVDHIRRSRRSTPGSTRRRSDGIEIERRWSPVARVGAYAPGGSAAYPSSLVMCAVPARVAGVGSFVVASPAGPDGDLDPLGTMRRATLLEERLAHRGREGALPIGGRRLARPDEGSRRSTSSSVQATWVTAAKLESSAT
jgi:histidinol dehydrogenase